MKQQNIIYKKAPPSAVIAEIARKHLRIESLVEVHSDREDFHDRHVCSIESALVAAFEAGRTSNENL